MAAGVSVVRWVCANPKCQRLAVEVRAPVAVPPEPYGPTTPCAWCGGRDYTKREAV